MSADVAKELAELDVTRDEAARLEAIADELRSEGPLDEPTDPAESRSCPAV